MCIDGTRGPKFQGCFKFYGTGGEGGREEEPGSLHHGGKVPRTMVWSCRKAEWLWVGQCQDGP